MIYLESRLFKLFVGFYEKFGDILTKIGVIENLALVWPWPIYAFIYKYIYILHSTKERVACTICITHSFLSLLCSALY